MCTYVVTIKVPWGQIAGKAWGHSNGRPVLALHGKCSTECILLYAYLPLALDLINTTTSIYVVCIFTYIIVL